MRRRRFLSSIGTGALAARAGAAQTSSSSGELKISAVEVWKIEGVIESRWLSPSQSNLQPIYIYEEYRPKPVLEYNKAQPGKRRQSRLYLRIKTGGGPEGLYGPIDTEAAIVVHRQLRPLLIGLDPLAGEKIWDVMFRRNRHSRAGHYMMGASAVDNALWDLRGRHFQAPVYRLLGGPTRRKIDVYGSTLGFSVAPAPARRRAVELKRQGFRRQKWFIAYGPGDGAEGLAKNVALVRNLREALGEEPDIMFDAFSGWDFNYAFAWAKRVEPYRPRWIEEAVHPAKIGSFAELRRRTSIPIATGEHIYNRWEAFDYFRAGAIDVVQADPEWCGGVSELVKICSAASLYDIPVIPHGHSVHAALHVVASQSPMTCPLVEYLINKMRNYYCFEQHPPKPVNGVITLPDRPGFGIQLDEAQIERQTLMKW